jgi:hypothetical protein
MLQYDREFVTSQVVLGHEPNVDFGDPGGHADDELIHQSLMGKRPSISYHRENNHSYRNLPPQEHHGHPPYSTMTSGEACEPTLSAVHFQAPVYHPSEAIRQQEQWQADNEYATALVGSLKIDDDGVGKS